MFVKPSGMPYYRFLRSLHEACLFDWYLEVGCRSGESFAPVRSKTVAVDPFFQAEINIIGKKPALHVFQATSDDFFASGFLARNDIRLGLAFLDGMHLFEFLLRDFIHTEAAMAPSGVILLHDCVPYGPGMTTRDLARLPKGSWTGDVWKLIPILQRWRPELTLTTLDCRSTGLVCVSGLDPANRVLADSYDRILAEFAGIDLEAFGVERFFGSFQMASARAERQAGFPLFRPASVDGVALEPVPVTP
ncbi:MAG: class I SAM-dependent methyltransferase [Tabrizicola sp.]|uniref:class I SAM-dependent methyltransferase n=1 Tax=Tabrizicola sp. TaxID=2005166 RepID=UPI002ABA4C9F|nr:class I SAM-dependent methyltransferase [Tabrizicola sp.]MDZ4088843.1 class I SAM-dependent methyltransferase [Tabrizicola sp.]